MDLRIATRALRGRNTKRSAEPPMTLLQGTVVAASLSFFGVVLTISYADPGYFDRMMMAYMPKTDLDPIETGSTQKADEQEIVVEPLPVPRVVRAERQPQDYQIIMIFGGEAHLAAQNELFRVEVGSELPGLGKILAIESGSNGGTIKAEKATLVGISAR